MDANERDHDNLTCGEYLSMQRARLDQITDLGVPGAKAAVSELLANIYAVNYQMMYERVEPPGPDRGPATREPLDRELVGQVSHALRSGAPEFQDIMNDSWKLSEAIYRSRQGNGFQLVEMVNMAHLARTAGSGVSRGKTPEQAQPQAANTAKEAKL